jgi:hypothetical protein
MCPTLPITNSFFQFLEFVGARQSSWEDCRLFSPADISNSPLQKIIVEERARGPPPRPDDDDDWSDNVVMYDPRTGGVSIVSYAPHNACTAPQS